MASRRNSGAIFLVYNGKMTCTFLLFYVTCYPRNDVNRRIETKGPACVPDD